MQTNKHKSTTVTISMNHVVENRHSQNPKHQHLLHGSFLSYGHKECGINEAMSLKLFSRFLEYPKLHALSFTLCLRLSLLVHC